MARPVETYRAQRRNAWRGSGHTWPQFQNRVWDALRKSESKTDREAAHFIGPRRKA